MQVGFLFVAAVAFFLLVDTGGMALPGMLATVLHECGHMAVLCAGGRAPKRVCLSPFGVDIVKQGGETSYPRELVLSLAGPCVNLLLLAGCFLTGNGGTKFAAANLLIGAMNLLPVGPLDGGQALYALLCMRYSEEKAEKVSSVLSFLVLLPLAVAGFWLLLRSRYNFSLLLISCYLMLLLLLKRTRI